MTKMKVSKSKLVAAGNQTTTGRLFVLDLSGGRILSVNPDGLDRRVLVTDCRLPDGVVVDVEAGHIYWTNMGVPSLNDGSRTPVLVINLGSVFCCDRAHKLCSSAFGVPVYSPFVNGKRDSKENRPTICEVFLIAELL